MEGNDLSAIVSDVTDPNTGKYSREALEVSSQVDTTLASCSDKLANLENILSHFLAGKNHIVANGFENDDISSDFIEKLHLAELNHSRSTKREEDKNHELQDLTNQLHVKETPIEKLNSDIACLVADNAAVQSSSKKAQKLEENLKFNPPRLEEEKALNEMRRKQLKEMEFEIMALREKTYAAESRAESAEEKATQLNESNLQLSEELRELDIQLQHSRASSEASQKQQNMLYSAIWDMETLIDELKQKVVKAENKMESAQDRCIILSETNSDINKELEFLRSRVEILEKSLNQSALEKNLCAEDISIRSSRIMKTVLQLGIERERIQKQLISCAKENNLLREKLKKEQKKASVILQDNKSCSCNEKEFQLSGLDSADSKFTKAVAVKATEISSDSRQVEKLSEDSIPNDNGRGASSSTNFCTNLVVQVEAQRLDENGSHQKTFTFVGFLLVVLSSLAAYLFQKKTCHP